jgi:hypothetical protein
MFFSKRRKLSWSGQQDKKKMYLGERPEIDLLLPGRDRIIILKKRRVREKNKIDAQLERVKKVLARENMQRNSTEA